MGAEYYIIYTAGNIVSTSVGNFDTSTRMGRAQYSDFLKLQQAEDNPNLDVIQTRIRQEDDKKREQKTDKTTGGWVSSQAKGAMGNSIQTGGQSAIDTEGNMRPAENAVENHLDKQKKKKKRFFGN